MPRRPHTFEITRLDQLRALASPQREEILDRLCRLGPAPISAIARSLGRKPQSLYPHFRKLEAVGLVREVGVRETGHRPEKLYDTPGRHYRVVHDRASPARRRALAAGVSAGLRRGERELVAALESAGATTRGEGRDTLWFQRSAWVTAPELAEINAHLDVIAKLLERARPEPGTRHLAVMFGLHPGTGGDHESE